MNILRATPQPLKPLTRIGEEEESGFTKQNLQVNGNYFINFVNLL